MDRVITFKNKICGNGAILIQLGQWPKLRCGCARVPCHEGAGAGVDLEEQAVCSGHLKRKRDTFLPLLEHTIAYLHEFCVRFHVGTQFF
jgi:hypothetical protein